MVHDLTTRPRLLMAPGCVTGSRSVESLQELVRTERGATLWRELAAKVDRERDAGPWTPHTPLPQRQAKQVRHGNREFELVGCTASRLVDGALVALVKESPAYVQGVWRQVQAIFDPEQWSEIDDLAHMPQNRCGLRRGQFATALGLAYDWLAPLLSEAQRRDWVAGFRERFVEPFRAAVEAGDPQVRGHKHNFTTVMYGGFAIAGLAMAEDLPNGEGRWLAELGQRTMDPYLEDLVGPEGEFNETVQYAGSVYGVFRYLAVRRAAEGTDAALYRRFRLDAFGRWYAHCTLPPGRVVGFGDNKAAAPPQAAIFGHLAAALGDPVFQWFYLHYGEATDAAHRQCAEELLTFDPTLDAEPPQRALPRGKRFSTQAQIVVSRSDWDATAARSIAYAKADLEPIHAHADWGQVCLDGLGERLLLDLGATDGYPGGSKERFYNYQQWGHNVLVIGEPGETGGVPVKARHADGELLHGRVTDAQFDHALGGAWVMDLAEVYGAPVKRQVVHLLPETLVVVDEARLEHDQPISLRWHPMTQPQWQRDGGFTARGDRAAVAGRVLRLDGEAQFRLGHHRYEAPYNRDRLGELYTETHEPYLELSAWANRCRVLSMFTVFPADQPAPAWNATAEGWQVGGASGGVQVHREGDRIVVADAATGRGWAVGEKLETL